MGALLYQELLATNYTDILLICQRSYVILVLQNIVKPPLLWYDI